MNRNPIRCAIGKLVNTSVESMQMSDFRLSRKIRKIYRHRPYHRTWEVKDIFFVSIILAYTEIWNLGLVGPMEIIATTRVIYL